MDDQLKSNLTSGRHWLRLVYMILFAICLQVASFVMTVLVVVQFLFALITGADNINLRKFGDSLSKYIYAILQFLIYNSEDKPFPFADWPESSVTTEIAPAAGSLETTPDTTPDTASKAKKPRAKKSPEHNDESQDDQQGENPVS